MADALCGPSNPLQNLQKQTSADRSLQRDRITSLPRTQQGFRSSGPNAGVLDPEFDSFQASQIPLAGPENHGLSHAAFPAGQGFQQNGQFRDSAQWVGDFSNMNLSGLSPMGPPGAAHSQHSARHGHNGVWQTEFHRQHSSLSSQGQAHQDGGFRGQTFGSGWTPMYASGPPMMSVQNQQVQHHQHNQATDDAFGKEEWDKLFDEFEEAESIQAPAVTIEEEYSPAGVEAQIRQRYTDGDVFNAEKGKARADVELGQNININETSTNPLEAPLSEPLQEQEQETKRLGADLIIDPRTDIPREERTSRDPAEDNEALARTAGHLLDSVSNNPDPKFQNSQFLRLMQQFRDREVAVQGNKIVGKDVGVGGGSEFDGEQMVPEVRSNAHPAHFAAPSGGGIMTAD